jgi:hypothetical protein
MPLTPDQTADYLAQEYLALEKSVEDFDARSLTIKAWSVTFSAAGLGLAYQQHSPPLLLIAAGSALVFWIVEAMWKVNQQAFYRRIRQIETHFRGGRQTVPFQVATSWFWSFRKQKKYRLALRIIWWPHVFLPHVIVMAAGVGLFFLYPPAVG